MGKGGLVLALLIAAAMAIVAYLPEEPVQLTGSSGLCLPSPAHWPLPPLAAWSINLLLLLLTAAGLSLFNSTYTLVPGSPLLLPGAFAIMAVSIPWVSGTLTSSVIMAPCMLGCMAILASCYKQQNATQEMFVVATIISLGSMIQYAFLLMIVPVVATALMYKCMHVREAMALLLGIVAPYWIVIGFGLVSPLEISIPTFTNLFDGYVPGPMLLVSLLNLGISALAAIVLALNNGIRLYAGNTRRRLMQMSMNVLGASCVACMILDYTNLTAYTVTFYMTVAMQWADLFALWNFRRPQIGVALLCALYIGGFAAAILL